MLHSRVGPALPIIPALRAVAGCAHEPLLHQREYFIRATSIPIAASLLIISFHPRGALGVGAGCWVCSEMMRCLCLTRYLWYQRRDILAFNVASEIFCAAPSLDKQQDGMVALAFLQCESSVLSLSGRRRGLSLAACHTNLPGFPTLHHHSAMLTLLSRRPLCSTLGLVSHCTHMLFSKAMLVGDFVIVSDLKKQPLSPLPANFIK